MSPRPTRPLAEKILAVAGAYNALAGELENRLKLGDPIVQAQLIEAATRLAMASDTKDVDMTFLREPHADA